MAARLTTNLAVSRLLVGAALLCSLQSGRAATQDATFAVKLLAPETALAAAQAALQQCRKAGYQVAVAVVDRFGTLQVLLRDRFAGAHTVEFATQKAWTAASFKVATSSLAEQTQAGKAMSGMRGSARVLAIGGGQTIEAGGTLLGGIGVSGAPGGEADDACAVAGLGAIADAIEF
jgi:uncharacterized protein GlcG (DUF336 family)